MNVCRHGANDVRPTSAGSRPRVVIVGGGFGGVSAAKKLRHAAVDVTLIDRTNHYLFQPLLYQVATGVLSAADIAVPTRFLLRKQQNARVVLATVTRVDGGRRLVFAEDQEIPYVVGCRKPGVAARRLATQSSGSSRTGARRA